MATFKVVVVGGGLSGALLANGLLNNGVDVTVYERDAADSKREGYQIRLGDAAMQGFKACLTKDCLSTILRKFGQSTLAASTAPTIMTTKFKPILDLTQSVSYSKSSAINRVALRNILLEPIKAAGRVRFDKSLVRYEIVHKGTDSEAVMVYFSDGSTHKCHVLIGADGSGSKINVQLGAKNIVNIDSHVAILNKGNLPVSRIKKLPQQLLKGPIILFAGPTMFFYALYLPAPRTQSSTRGDVEVVYDVDEASFYWGLTVPRQAFPNGDPSQVGDYLSFCLDHVKDWAPEYKVMLSSGEEEGAGKNVIVAPLRASRALSKSWRDQLRQGDRGHADEGHPRVWLMGDAVHPMQPNRGMGGNQAMHDCADALPELLKLNDAAKEGTPPSTGHISQALKAYEDKMIDRAFTWVKKSGGTSIMPLNFDGMVGTLVWFLGKLLLPVVNFWAGSFKKKSKSD